MMLWSVHWCASKHDRHCRWCHLDSSDRRGRNEESQVYDYCVMSRCRRLRCVYQGRMITELHCRFVSPLRASIVVHSYDRACWMNVWSVGVVMAVVDRLHPTLWRVWARDRHHCADPHCGVYGEYESESDERRMRMRRRRKRRMRKDRRQEMTRTIDRERWLG